jgi:hypothetical protein
MIYRAAERVKNLFPCNREVVFAADKVIEEYETLKSAAEGFDEELDAEGGGAGLAEENEKLRRQVEILTGPIGEAMQAAFVEAIANPVADAVIRWVAEHPPTEEIAAAVAQMKKEQGGGTP